MEATIGEFSTDIRLTGEEAKEFCKPGTGADTCIWLVVDTKGICCTFYNKPYVLVTRWEDGLTVAKRDGCDKVKNMPWPQGDGTVTF